MKIHVSPLLTAAVVAALTGCATVPEITVLSDPPGAMISEAGQVFGRAPVTLNATTAQDAVEQGLCTNTIMALVARWPSGAQASLTPDICQDQQQVLIERPKGAPGLDEDLKFATAYLQMQAAQAAAQASQAADDAAAIAAIEAIDSAPDASPAPSSIHCQTRQDGAQVDTDCD